MVLCLLIKQELVVWLKFDVTTHRGLKEANRCDLAQKNCRRFHPCSSTVVLNGLVVEGNLRMDQNLKTKCKITFLSRQYTAF